MARAQVAPWKDQLNEYFRVSLFPWALAVSRFQFLIKNAIAVIWSEQSTCLLHDQLRAWTSGPVGPCG